MSRYPARVQPGDMQPYGALPVPHVTPEMVGLIKTGKVYSLAIVHYEGIPVPDPMVPYTLTPRLRHGDLADIAPASAAAEAVTMAAHTGTHIDALCHIGEHRGEDGQPHPKGDVYLHDDHSSGVRARDCVNFQGQTHLSIEQMPPIITRGVLVDVAGQKGVDVLPSGYAITAEDIDAALVAQGTDVRPGTAVLVRTGFYQHLRDGSPVYRDGIAGLGLSAAQRLFALGMTLVGADNMTVEAFPPYDHAVHRFLLVRNGVTHVENLYLETLAAERIYEFLLIVTPLRLQGATGSWVHPIAIG